jgi:HJR/Mrr/RecB family endonuclease
LFALMGYAVTPTPSTGDGGVDLILQMDGKRTVVQCKAHTKRIPISVARELAASMRDFNADKAIIACLDGVTKPVAEYIKNKQISVLDLKAIVALQRERGFEHLSQPSSAN